MASDFSPLLLAAILTAAGLVWFAVSLFRQSHEAARKEGGPRRALDFAGQLLRRSKRSFSRRVPADIRTLLKASHVCPECGHPEERVSVFSTRAAELSSFVLSWDHLGWILLACSRCGHALIYSYHVVLKDPFIHKARDKAASSPPCRLCRSGDAEEIVTIFRDPGLSDYSPYAGKYRALVCLNCGATRFYELEKPPPSPHWGRKFVEALRKLNMEFRCKGCGGEKGVARVVAATEGPMTSLFDVESMELIVVSCESCRLVEAYDTLFRVHGAG